MRFGVIGCGLIAQVMHVPYLAEIPEAELSAFVDPAEGRAQKLADRYNVDDVYPSHERLLDVRGDELDAVVVLTPSHHHAEVAVDTLENGIHTLVEKPISASLEDANRMVEADRNSNATAMVAYMKRYDPAYERATEAISDLASVDLVTAYDVDPDHSRIIEEVYDVIAGDPPEEVVEESKAKRRADIERAIGTDDALLIDAYDFQLEHVCHDVNVLRGLFGDVEGIANVDVFAEGRYATAKLTYVDGIECILETGDSDRKWFEEFVRVDGPDGMVELSFSNPFIRNTPSELRVKRGLEELSETVHLPSYTEPFKRELEHFIQSASDEGPVRTPFEEARSDLGLIIDIFRTYRGEMPRA